MKEARGKCVSFFKLHWTWSLKGSASISQSESSVLMLVGLRERTLPLNESSVGQDEHSFRAFHPLGEHPRPPAPGPGLASAFMFTEHPPLCDEASCVQLQQSSSREIFFNWMIHIHHQPSLLNLIIGHNMGTKIKSTKPVQNRFEDEKATLPKNVHTLKVFYNRSKYLNKQSTWFWVSVVGIKMRKCFLVFSFILSPNSVGWL